MYKDKKKDCCTPFNLRAAELKINLQGGGSR
jgi:hypothetical protein